MDFSGEMYEVNDPNHNPNAGLFVEFFFHPSKDEEASATEGRPIYKDYEYLRCVAAGDRSNEIVRPATAIDRKRFARQYAAFKNGQEVAAVGTPLESWPLLTKGQVEELKYFNCKTVEDLANMSDSNAQNFRAISSLRQQARAFIEAAKGNAPLVKMQAELEKRDEQIELLNQQLKDVVAELAAIRKSKEK